MEKSRGLGSFWGCKDIIFLYQKHMHEKLFYGKSVPGNSASLTKSTIKMVTKDADNESNPILNTKMKTIKM